jgi:hypothetical protein
MYSPFGNSKSYFVYLIKWMGIHLGISLAISFILPFPLSLIAFIGICFLIQFDRTFLRNSKSGGMELRVFFNPYSSSMFGLKPPSTIV